jgi:short-subunit dehydrogenase
MSEINRRLGGVDILINNAGLIDRSAVEESSTQRRIRLLEVNYLAPFDLISLVLSSMRKKNTGRIINISSAGGFMAMPTMAAYNASKFALEGASEALWYEVKPWGIHVTLVIPGFINSMGFLHTTESPRCKQSIGDTNSTYHEHYINMKNMIFNKMTRSHSSNELIARKIVKIMAKKNPPLRAYATLDARFFHLLKRICPQKLYHIIVYRLLPNIRSWGKQKHRKR